MTRAYSQLSLILMSANVHAGYVASPGKPLAGSKSPAFITASSPRTPCETLIWTRNVSGIIARLRRVRTPSLYSTTNQPDVEKFNNLIYATLATDDTAQLLRDELKSRLLLAADDFGVMRAQEEAIASKAKDVDDKTNAPNERSDRGYVIRLLQKIVRKI